MKKSANCFGGILPLNFEGSSGTCYNIETPQLYSFIITITIGTGVGAPFSACIMSQVVHLDGLMTPLNCNKNACIILNLWVGRGREEFKFDVFLYLTQAHNFSQLVRKLVDIFGAAACALSPIYGAASSWAAYSYSTSFHLTPCPAYQSYFLYR